MFPSDGTSDTHLFRYRYNYERTNCQRFPERYTPVQNLGSLDRYHGHATLDRYSRTATPTDRYHTLSTDKERCNGDRYNSANVDGFNGDRHASERHRSGSKSEVYKIRDRSASSDRKDREKHQREQYQNRLDQYVNERFNQDRYPNIPCPERFASHERPERPERIPFSQLPYMEPPSPAPAGDRFIPPPPLSPENTPSPDCFTNNTFPSPTATLPPPERFVPPPPLSPSPTETYAPSPKKSERYDKTQRYQGYAAASPNTSGDRYHDSRFKDRYQNYADKYQNSSGHQNYHSDKYVNNGERYLPPNAHMPVDRYVPQPQEPYYGPYHPYGFKQQFASNDPYMRRDLGFHYRLPLPYTPNQYQRMRYSHLGTPNRVKCCQFQEGYQLSKSSPGSSSSSSVTSQGKELHQKEAACANLQEIQCQNFQGKEYHCAYQMEKGTQCQGKECLAFAAQRAVKGGQCRHSICASPSVEYVGASGGRHVCATPPPRATIGPVEGVACSENCCARRAQASLTVTVW